MCKSTEYIGSVWPGISKIHSFQKLGVNMFVHWRIAISQKIDFFMTAVPEYLDEGSANIHQII